MVLLILPAARNCSKQQLKPDT